MSIEQALAEQTAAIRENTRAIVALSDAWNALRDRAMGIEAGKEIVVAKTPMADAPEVKTEKPKAEKKKAEDAPKAEAPAPTPPAEETKPAEPEAAAASPSELPDIKALSAVVTAAATRNREGMLAVLAKHGVERASHLPQEKWRALMDEMEAV